MNKERLINFGYADGDYFHRACNGCQREFTASKRSINCEVCATALLKEYEVVIALLPDFSSYETCPSRKYHLHVNGRRIQIDGVFSWGSSEEVEKALNLDEELLARALRSDAIRISSEI